MRGLIIDQQPVISRVVIRAQLLDDSSTKRVPVSGASDDFFPPFPSISCSGEIRQIEELAYAQRSFTSLTSDPS